VEKYASLQAQIKELQAQLDEVKQSIIDYCQTAGLNRVFGSTCEITYKMVEKSGYAEDEVKALLQPEGLWEKVLGFDAALLKQLLADKTLPPELKKKLEALKKVTTAYPQLWLRARAAEEEE
jgi:fructose-specific component phosphotransferase system IIB-like protein